MAIPVLHLPVVQNWDCQATGSCCKEYQVNLTAEERQRITAQGWDRVKDLGGYAPFRRRGWLRRRFSLNHRPEGSCVFLSPQGRCRIHEQHGYDAKPLACRLFPFVLVPVADHWRVSLHFSCPSAAASVGRPLAEHGGLLDDLAGRLAERENLDAERDGGLVLPPPLVAGQRLDWPELLSLVDQVLSVLRDRNDSIERRWRRCLVVADLLRQTRLDQLSRNAREETVAITLAGAADVPRDPFLVPAPSALGRVIFRLLTALCTRKDRGPNRGLASRGWFALVGGVLRFARGTGPIPQMNGLLPPATFESAEEPMGPLPESAAEVFERYYAIKVGSLQFCGPAAFGLPVWEGLEALALTVPLNLWLMRLFKDLPPEKAAARALTIIDGHFCSNPVLASRRLRLGFQSLARRGELARLIAWYSR
jgi:lysine-N-methylase